MSPRALLLSLSFGVMVGSVSGAVGRGREMVPVPSLPRLFPLLEWDGIPRAPAYGAVVAHATALLLFAPTAAAGSLCCRRCRPRTRKVALPGAGAAPVGVPGAFRLPPEILMDGLPSNPAALGTKTRAGTIPGPGRTRAFRCPAVGRS